MGWHPHRGDSQLLITNYQRPWCLGVLVVFPVRHGCSSRGESALILTVRTLSSFLSVTVTVSPGSTLSIADTISVPDLTVRSLIFVITSPSVTEPSAAVEIPSS